MFNNLLDFGYQRSKKEAVGFYIAYLALLMIVLGLIGGVMAVVTADNNSDFRSGFTLGTKIGAIFAPIGSMLVSFLVVRAKGLFGSFGYVLLILLSGIVGLFLGGIGGLIPAAYLSTRPKPPISSSSAV